MKVVFRQFGGFAGLLRGCELDTRALPTPQARELERLVQKSGIVGHRHAHSESARDLQEYEIEIQDNGNSASVAFDDGTVPSGVQPLLKLLKRCAVPSALK